MTKTISFKNSIITLLIAVAFLLAQAFGLSFGTSNITDTDAISSELGISSRANATTFTNNNFATASSTTTYPGTPNGWTATNSNAKQVIAGVVDLSASGYAKHGSNYNLPTQPIPHGQDEQYALMINGDSSEVYYSYKSNSSITLDANSFYTIRLYINTGTSAKASISLVGTSFDDIATAHLSNLNTSQNWQEVVFYIATSSYKNSTVALNLSLGNKGEPSPGYVLFDNVNIYQHSLDNFNSLYSQKNGITSYINLVESPLNFGNGVITNGNFADELDSWEYTGNVQYVSNFNQHITILNKSLQIGTLNTLSPNGALLIANNNVTTLTSSEITIDRQGLYRITFWAKGSLDSGNIDISLGGLLPDTKEDTTQSKSITSLADGNELRNYWSMYEFYVIGHPLSQGKIKLQFSLGSETASATGYLAISQINTYLMDSTSITTATENATSSQQLEFYPTATTTFTNSTFNLTTQNADHSLLQPNGWSELKENQLNAGVTNFDKGNGQPNNVLQLQNLTKTYSGFTSDTGSLSADGYAQITLTAHMPTALPVGSYAYVQLLNSDGLLFAQFKFNNTNKWQKFTVYVKNYFVAQTVSIKLSLGTQENPALGLVYFDDCEFDNTTTEETFNAVTTSNTIQKVDLTSDLLNLTTQKIEANINKPALWTQNNIQGDNIAGGIINTANSSTLFGTNFKNSQNTDGNILFISSDQNVYSNYSTALAYTFNSGSYYKVSVWVKTINIPENDQTSLNEKGDLIIHGASINIDGIEGGFNGINTMDKSSSITTDNQDGWKEYTFFINPDTTVNAVLRLGLGSSDSVSSGSAFFDNITIISLDEDGYKNQTSTIDTENLPENILFTSNTTEAENNSDTSTYGDFDWLAIPTLIIAVAVLVAVIGYLVKRFYRALPEKTSVNTNYDRLQTLLKDVDRRERNTQIAHKLKLLKEDLTQTQKFLSEEIAEYDKQKNAFSTAQEIAKDNPSITLDAPNEKQMIKSINNLEDKINSIQGDITVLENEQARIKKQHKTDIDKADNMIRIKKRK